MPDLTTDPVPYAEFILRHLMQRVAPDGSPACAVAETEHAVDGDRWFWADDNAKVLEFLAIPALWDRYPDACTDVLRFIERLCDGPFILRRTGHARLEEVALDGGVGRWIHTFMHVSCDLPKGILRIGMRFHDGRTAHNLALTGNYVHFTHEGRRHSLDVEDAIAGWETRRDGPTLLLSHASELRFEAESGQQRLGRLEYRYRIDARSMFIDAEAVLDLDPAVTVADVVLTIGQDNLSHMDNHVHYGCIGIARPEAAPLHFTAEQAGHTGLDCAGAPYWSIYQRQWMSGFAIAIHSLPVNPATLESVQAVSRDRELLQWVVTQHRFSGSHCGGRMVAAERKIITAGGFYDQVDECAEMLARHSAMPLDQPVDLSVSYDYGAEINAFARLHRTLTRLPQTPVTHDLRTRTRQLFDRYYDVYARLLLAQHEMHPAAIFSRPLAFAIFGLVDMALTTGEAGYREEIARAIRVLLTFERNFQGPDGRTESAFLMGQVASAAPYVDCHSSALIALIRALPVLEDAALVTSIDRGLEAYRVETTPIELGDLRKMDTVTVHWRTPEGQHVSRDAYWNFGAGLTLRVFKLLRHSPHRATQEIFERHRLPIEAAEAILRLQVRRALRARGSALEVLTGLLSAEGNSETQPWVALGVVGDSGDI